MSARKLARPAGLLALLATAGTVGAISYRRVEDQLAVIEGCEATRVGDWAAALEQTEGRVGTDDTGRAAAECRCLALLARQAGSECVALLERLLAGPEGDGWTPQPRLAVHLIQTWRDEGRTLEAAELARRAARRHPDDPDLFYLELVTRSSTEDEQRVLNEMEAHIAAGGPNATRMRVSLANRHLLRGDPARALAVLGDAPPDDARAAALWFDVRGMAHASAGDWTGVQRTYQQWRAAGGDPSELLARYALTMSMAGLRDPRHAPLELLRRALAGAGHLDPQLQEALTIRLILTLVNDERPREALAVYETARERFELRGLTRAEIERSAVHRELGRLPGEERSGAVRFAIPDPEPGSRLWLSPAQEAPVDADFAPMEIPASGEVEVRRSLGVAPVRWVIRDAGNRALASGTVHPVAGGIVDVVVRSSPPRAPRRAELRRRPGDGRRRVALLVLDCADWRLVQYLRARGELPVLDALIARGYRAVLDSDPPLTAAALQALVSPGRDRGRSVFGLLHQFGVELAGLASVGENPLSALTWILPEETDLFSVIGAGERTAANLLFAHGGIRAGRHGEITGPQGRRRRVPLAQSARDLDAEERSRWPDLARAIAPRDALHVRTIAAEFDSAEALLRDGEIDLLALRIEPLDILTHAHFADSVRDGQDDGEGFLFSVYRYIDARLGELHDLLDQDDVLVVMSDHGIRTAMEHSRHALFVAAGPGIPSDRAPERPALRGVARMVADLLDVPTDWPQTGLAPWLQANASAGAAAQLATEAGNDDPSLPIAAH